MARLPLQKKSWRQHFQDHSRLKNYAAWMELAIFEVYFSGNRFLYMEILNKRKNWLQYDDSSVQSPFVKNTLYFNAEYPTDCHTCTSEVSRNPCLLLSLYRVFNGHIVHNECNKTYFRKIPWIHRLMKRDAGFWPIPFTRSLGQIICS